LIDQHAVAQVDHFKTLRVLSQLEQQNKDQNDLSLTAFPITFITWNGWTIITLDLEFTFFDFVTITIWVITTDMQFTTTIDHITVHRSTAHLDNGVSTSNQQFQHHHHPTMPPKIRLVLSSSAFTTLFRW
jgi:hypothetical protein